MKRSSSRSGDAAAPPVKAAMVRLNVGGELFATTMETLSKAAYFNPFLSGRIPHGEDEGAHCSSIVAPNSSLTSCSIFGPVAGPPEMNCGQLSTLCGTRPSTMGCPASSPTSTEKSPPMTCARRDDVNGCQTFGRYLSGPWRLLLICCNTRVLPTGGSHDSCSRAAPSGRLVQATG